MKVAWSDRQVSDVLKLEYGKPLDDSDRTPDGLYPIYGANGTKGRTNKFYSDKPSIIVGRKGSAGELNLSEEKFWPLDVTYFVTFDDRQHDLRFLFNLLTTLDLPSLAKGVKPGINRNEVYSKAVRIPPLQEQKRIVAILDEAFDGIATAKANAEKNLQNARELFESHLQSVFTQRGEGWVENAKPLADLCDLIVDCEHKTAPTQKEGIPSIRTPNIGKGKLLLDGVYRVSEETYREWTRRAEPLPGDLILARHEFALKQRQSFLLDGTLSSYGVAERNTKRSLDKGRTVQILYVYQEPEQAWRFVQAREVAEGRRIQPEDFIRQYFDARNVANRLKEEFGQKIQMDLLMKNNDGTHRFFRAGVDKIDNHIPEKYSLADVRHLIGLN